jgi:hypothetical protein
VRVLTLHGLKKVNVNAQIRSACNGATSAGVGDDTAVRIVEATRKPRMNFGKRRQVSLAPALD